MFHTQEYQLSRRQRIVYLVLGLIAYGAAIYFAIQLRSSWIACRFDCCAWDLSCMLINLHFIKNDFDKVWTGKGKEEYFIL